MTTLISMMPLKNLKKDGDEFKDIKLFYMP